MKWKIKTALKRLFWPLIAFYKLILRPKSYLHKTGWTESIKRNYPCLSDGSEVPWMNYPIINFLRKRLQNDARLFEYGSGYSTIFYSRLVQKVTSVEYSKHWLAVVEKKVPENVTLMYREKDTDQKYCRAINETDDLYDVVIVDGEDRVNCVKQSIDSLTEKGVIILDDSQREHYQEAIDYAKQHGFRDLDMEGIKPTGFGVDRSTILYRSENCLGI